MTNEKATKRALLSSVMALFICFTMLLGTTYAWFTDSVTSANNIIQAGNLDIGVYYATPADVVDGDIPADSWKPVTADKSIFNNNALWEPGYTEAVFLKFVNEGTLALQYQLKIDILNEKQGTNVFGEKYSLSEFIQAYACNCFSYDYTNYLFTDREDAIDPVGAPDPYYDTLYNAANGDIATPSGDNPLSLDSWQWLAPDEITYATLVLWMPTTVDNRANPKTPDDAGKIDLGVSVLATQYTYEEDAFDDQYDQNAEYVQTVSTLEELIAALKNGGKIVLEKDIVVTQQLTIEKDVVLDLNGHELQANMTESLDGVYDTLIRIENGATMSIYGDGAVNLADGVGRWIRCVYGATINIYGGNWVQESDDFNASSNPHYCEGIYANERGNVNIYGGTFKFDTVPYYTLNESRGGQITVYGGTFINFNPSKSAAGDGSYVAKGYMVVSEEQENGDVWYTVVPVPEGYVAVSNAKEATDALVAGGKIVLSDNITLNEKLTIDTPVDIDLNGKDLATVGLELKQGGSIKNGNIKSAGDINTDGGNWVFHFLVSGGTLTMDDVNVAITDSFYADTGYNSSSQACGIRAENAKLILNNCNVKVHNDTNNVYFVQSWAVDMLNSEITMNGGSIVAMCEKGTAADVDGLDDPAFACAIAADGICTATLNGVKVEATYFGEVFDWQDYSSNFTFNTTDTNVSADDFILWWSAEITVNHIN